MPSALAGVEVVAEFQSTPVMSSAVIAKSGLVRIANRAWNSRTVVFVLITLSELICPTNCCPSGDAEREERG
jgi:hypothetical protein